MHQNGRFTCIANNTKGETKGTVDVTIGGRFPILNIVYFC